jgi:hypothetical protein
MRRLLGVVEEKEEVIMARYKVVFLHLHWRNFGKQGETLEWPASRSRFKPMASEYKAGC